MKKILYVGDPHVKISNLKESQLLLNFVIETITQNSVDKVVILGDLMHTHALIRLEVQHFWTEALYSLNQLGPDIVILTGNHDMNGDYKANFSALSLFANLNLRNIHIVENQVLLGRFGYLPYFHDKEAFIKAANSLADGGAKVLVCHQTIQGSRYENGFYSEDGVPTAGWAERFVHVISGHIHAEQTFENVIYPGTARWDNIADANQRKGIWIYTHADSGLILESQFISTENVCAPLRSITWKEGEDAPKVWGDNERVTLELIGSSEWIMKQKLSYKGKATFKTKITDNKKLETRKAGRNFQDFVQNFFVSSKKEELLKCAKEIGLV